VPAEIDASSMPSLAVSHLRDRCRGARESRAQLVTRDRFLAEQLARVERLNHESDRRIGERYPMPAAALVMIASTAKGVAARGPAEITLSMQTRRVCVDSV